MTSYISLLRGINVAGQKSIKMADLRAIYQDLALSNVQSYIQSGNVLFDSDNNDCQALAKTISQAILCHYHFDVAVQVLTVAHLKKALLEQPFKNIDLEKEGSKVLFCLLSGKADRSNFQQILDRAKPNEHLHLTENVLYLYCEEGVGKSKLVHSFIEKKLAVNATSRNIKTIKKLIMMSESQNDSSNNETTPH
jgi:uncharacterized protein (DUF1697 family)